MPSRAWVVTQQHGYKVLFLDIVSMPSRAWVVTNYGLEVVESIVFQCPLGLELLHEYAKYKIDLAMFQCPLGLELLQVVKSTSVRSSYVSMPSRAWVVTLKKPILIWNIDMFQCPLGLELLRFQRRLEWDSSRICFNALSGLSCYEITASTTFTPDEFQCPLGLELLRQECPIF